MKKIAFLTIICVFTGCTYSYVEVIVENSTEHNIRLEAYYTEDVLTGEKADGTFESITEEVKIELITIKPFDRFVRAQNYHPEDSRYYYLFEEHIIDSVYINFNNDRVIKQCCEDYELGLCLEPVERNILDIGVNYEREDLGRKEYHFTYKITQEDYDRAMPIN